MSQNREGEWGKKARMGSKKWDLKSCELSWTRPEKGVELEDLNALQCIAVDLKRIRVYLGRGLEIRHLVQLSSPSFLRVGWC